ncbi:heterokaryon incompatibility protein-domain-containing protein [Biscogniauxia marginata]|nr:heterokaryon incompatibility protein-domain-containing protein [Biscogniauxia marginata]
MARTHAEVARAKIYSRKLLNRDGEYFRFITILPSDDDDQRISCKLETKELVEGLRYAALSYVWGDPHNTENIEVDGHTLPITTNLASALWHFRKYGLPQNQQTGTISLLWVDAICINQDDDKERGHQVRKMGSLYNKATSVLSWLGPPGLEALQVALNPQDFDEFKRFAQNPRNTSPRFATESDDGLETALQIIHGVAGIVGINKPVHSTMYRDLDAEKVRDAFLYLYSTLGPLVLDPVAKSNRWLPLRALSKCKYWSRIWIIQEMVLAKSPWTHLFISGNCYIAFGELKAFELFIRSLRKTPIPSDFSPKSQERLSWLELLHDSNYHATVVLMIVDMWDKVQNDDKEDPQLPYSIHWLNRKRPPPWETNLPIAHGGDCSNTDVSPTLDGLMKIFESIGGDTGPVAVVNVKLNPIHTGDFRPPPIPDLIEGWERNDYRGLGRDILFSVALKAAVLASASNPRDFVYGVLGLVDTDIEPDYEKSVREIYLEAFSHDDFKRNLETCLQFSGCGFNSTNPHQLPSWLPDLSQLSNSKRLAHFVDNDSERRCLPLDAREYRQPEVTPEGILRISGVVCDHVEQVKPLLFTSMEDDTSRALVQLCVDYLVEFRPFNESDGPPLKSLVEVLDWRGKGSRTTLPKFKGMSGFSLSPIEWTLVFVLVSAQNRMTDDEVKVYWRRLRQVLEFPEESLGHLMACCLAGNRDFSIDWEAMEGSDIDSTEADFRAMIEDCTDRALFKTSKGHLGIGPLYLRPGDRVCAVDRGTLPVLLREIRQGPRVSCLEHIGSCYVLGLSDGEPAEMVANEELRLETFEIK